MPLPAYMWMKDDAGADISGSVDIAGREGSVEILALDHLVHVPIDPSTGLPTGVRQHMPIVITKAIDSSSTFLLDAVCRNKILSEVEFKFYRINYQGEEVEYYNILLQNVKVASVKTEMPQVKYQENERLVHMEKIAMRYQSIVWTFVDGNLTTSDTWKESR